MVNNKHIKFVLIFVNRVREILRGLFLKGLVPRSGGIEKGGVLQSGCLLPHKKYEWFGFHETSIRYLQPILSITRA
jgi:hypothetical protein